MNATHDKPDGEEAEELVPEAVAIEIVSRHFQLRRSIALKWLDDKVDAGKIETQVAGSIRRARRSGRRDPTNRELLAESRLDDPVHVRKDQLLATIERDKSMFVEQSISLGTPRDAEHQAKYPRRRGRRSTVNWEPIISGAMRKYEMSGGKLTWKDMKDLIKKLVEEQNSTQTLSVSTYKRKAGDIMDAWHARHRK